MSTLTVRRLRVDLDTPLAAQWAGDAFRTAFFNALSMSFPAGEQLFIDSVRKGLADFVAYTGADELMVTASVHDHAARLRSFEITAQANRAVAEAA